MMFTAGACTLFGVAISGAQALTELLLYAIPAFIVGLGIYKLGGRLWQGKKDKKATDKRP